MPKLDMLTLGLLDEISLVSDPMNQLATADVAKNQEGTPVEKRLADLLTSAAEGHEHGISTRNWGDNEVNIILESATASGETGWHEHPLVKNADGTWKIGMAAGHSHTVDGEALNAAAAAAVASNIVMKGEQEMPNEVTTPNEQIDMAGLAALMRKNAEATEGLVTAVQSLTDWKEETEKAAALSPQEQQVYGGLTDETKKQFLDASPQARQVALAQVQKADAEKQLGTQEVYKSESTGQSYTANDDPRVVEMAKQRDIDHAMLQQVLAENGNLSMQKRAETELSLAPGSIEAKAELLKQIDGIENEDLRREAGELLKGLNNSMGFLTQSLGTTGVQSGPMSTEQAETVQKQAERNLLSAGLITQPILEFNKQAETIQLENVVEGMQIGEAMVKLAETQAGRTMLERHYLERGQ